MGPETNVRVQAMPSWISSRIILLDLVAAFLWFFGLDLCADFLHGLLLALAASCLRSAGV